MSDFFIPPRPQTPQVLLHHLPDKPDALSITTRKPSKHIVLIMGSTAVAGKVQIAQSVAKALSCPLYHGDSLHESSAKAASVGASRRIAAAATVAAGGTSGGSVGEVENVDGGSASLSSGANEARYQRMWLSKMTRTGLLFPEESRPANEGSSRFTGASSTSTSRRGSASSVASSSSYTAASPSVTSSSDAPMNSGPPPPPLIASTFATANAPDINNPVFTLSERERLQRENPALMVLTHPEVEKWHKFTIRNTVGEYGIGVIFVPLYHHDAGEDDEDEEDLPILRPLDPTTMTSFPASFANKARDLGSLDVEMKLSIDVDADVEDKIREIIDGVRDIMGIDE